MSLAILCSGQGGQHASMFDIVEGEAGIDALMTRANECAQFDLVAAVRADGEAMFDNAIAQPLICAYQGVIWTLLERRLEQAGPGVACIAGYSVGELASYGCAGCLSWADTIGLARRRAAAMDAASAANDGLAAVRGVSRAGLEAILANHGVFVAIVNGEDHFIVGGVGSALDAMTAEVVALGGTAQRLPVAIAAHTPLLADAVARFREQLGRRAWKPPRVPVLSGLDGSIVRDSAAAIDVLSRQIAETVRWADCMEGIRERRVDTCLELGPGNALARMMRDRNPAIEARAIADFRSIDAVVDWVVRTSR